MKEWRGRSIACIASGPSLTLEDCEAVRCAGCLTIVTNTTFRLCPWADALFGFDAKWWRMHLGEVRATFKGRLLTQHASRIARDVECVRRNPLFRSFGNSGANAISFAVLSGAARVILLGYDCQFGPNGEAHHHADHPPGLENCATIARWPGQFERLAQYAQRRRVPMLNASRQTALTCFPRATLADALHDNVDLRHVPGCDLRSATGGPAEVRPEADH